MCILGRVGLAPPTCNHGGASPTLYAECPIRRRISVAGFDSPVGGEVLEDGVDRFGGIGDADFSGDLFGGLRGRG